MIRQNPIQLKLLNAGYNQKDLRGMTFLSTACISSTLILKSHNYEIQMKVAELVGENPETLWGDHFAPTWRKNKTSLSE